MSAPAAGTTQESATTVRIPARRVWSLRFTLFGAGLLIAGVLAFVFASGALRWAGLTVGGIGLIVGLGSIPLLLSKTPIVEADEDGVRVRMMNVTVSRLPWNIIEGFRTVEAMGMDWLAILVTDTDAADTHSRPEYSALSRRLRSETRAKGGAFVKSTLIATHLSDAIDRLERARRSR